ncbi:MAG: ribonuclease E inhibitor RraB [Planctomycetaceae bacterium]
MADEYPDDLDGEVLRMIAEDGNDMTQPMEVEFHVAAATEEDAETIADAAEKLGYEAFIDFDDGSDDEDLEDEITEPWTCTCRRTMVLEYDAIMQAQAELDELARPLGGYADGWGTFGNVEREESGEDEE